MTKIEIENDLRQQLEKLLVKYPDATFKYAYDDNRKVYLVSDIIDVNRDDYEQYCEDVMRVEDELNDRYGFYAPLFTSNERSFSLPKDADEVSSQIMYVVDQLTMLMKSMKSIKIYDRHTDVDDSYSLTYQVPHTFMTNGKDECPIYEYVEAA